jgi:hypothetical protein
LCGETAPSTTPVLNDLGVVAGHVLLPAPFIDDLPPIDRSWGSFGVDTTDFDVVREFRAIFEADPRKHIWDFVERIDDDTGGRTGLYFLHALVPHHPWQFLPDGSRYPLNTERSPGSDSPGWGEDEFLVAQAMQRHLLQVGYVDHALGEILAALDDAGIYEDALIIMTADHGISVKPGVDHQRQIEDDTVGEIAEIPLLVKAPGREGGVIDDRRALTIDIMPTIADVLGTDLPWPADGVSLFGPDPGRTETTTTGPRSQITFGVDGTEKLAVAERLEGLFPGGDPFALLPDGAPDMRGQSVDAGRAEAPFRATLDGSSAYDDVDLTSGVIPVRTTGKLLGDVQGDEFIGVAVNGTIGAVTRSYVEDGKPAFQAMVPPDLFRSGSNDVELFLIDGEDLFEIPIG